MEPRASRRRGHRASTRERPRRHQHEPSGAGRSSGSYSRRARRRGRRRRQPRYAVCERRCVLPRAARPRQRERRAVDHSAPIASASGGRRPRSSPTRSLDGVPQPLRPQRRLHTARALHHADPPPGGGRSDQPRSQRMEGQLIGAVCQSRHESPLRRSICCRGGGRRPVRDALSGDIAIRCRRTGFRLTPALGASVAPWGAHSGTRMRCAKWVVPPPLVQRLAVGPQRRGDRPRSRRAAADARDDVRVPRWVEACEVRAGVAGLPVIAVTCCG